MRDYWEIDIGLSSEYFWITVTDTERHIASTKYDINLKPPN
jgi:hypothetical protein